MSRLRSAADAGNGLVETASRLCRFGGRDIFLMAQTPLRELREEESE
jgi:hypothetical protein